MEVGGLKLGEPMVEGGRKGEQKHSP